MLAGVTYVSCLFTIVPVNAVCTQIEKKKNSISGYAHTKDGGTKLKFLCGA